MQTSQAPKSQEKQPAKGTVLTEGPLSPLHSLADPGDERSSLRFPLVQWLHRLIFPKPRSEGKPSSHLHHCSTPFALFFTRSLPSPPTLHTSLKPLLPVVFARGPLQKKET